MRKQQMDNLAKQRS